MIIKRFKETKNKWTEKDIKDHLDNDRFLKDLLKYFIYKSKARSNKDYIYTLWKIIEIKIKDIEIIRLYTLTKDGEIKQAKGNSSIYYEISNIPNLKERVVFESNNFEETLEKLNILKNISKYNI